MGKDNTALSTEARILQHARQTEGRGKEHTVQLLDLFTIKGSNGYHGCFVTEVIVPLSAIDLETSKNFLPKPLNKQISLGLDCPHSQKIAHGDPHYGSTGIAVPQMNPFNRFDLKEHIGGELELSPVIPINVSYPMQTVPAYMVGVFSIFGFLRDENAFPTNDEQCVRILEFGRSCWIDAPRHLEDAGPMACQPPEVSVYGSDISNGEIGCVWSQQSDIWAIARVFSRIETGMPLFKPRGPARDQIIRNTELSGPVPQAWCMYWPQSTGKQGHPTELELQKVEKACSCVCQRIAPCAVC